MQDCPPRVQGAGTKDQAAAASDMLARCPAAMAAAAEMVAAVAKEHIPCLHERGKHTAREAWAEAASEGNAACWSLLLLRGCDSEVDIHYPDKLRGGHSLPS